MRLPRPPAVRRVVVFLPNGFTLFNLFCGIYAIVLASRADFSTAAFFIVLGGVADALDGRIARATGTFSRFGEELDSLVDAISFGLAPALIMYFAVLSRANWDWLFVFIFASCAVMRLARFNVEQSGRQKMHFHGLPSPAAGMTLATYYWFSQTPLYNQAVILFTDMTLADLPWHTIMRWLMALLAFLMISDVPYPAVPAIGFRRPRQIVGTLVIVGSILGLIFLPSHFIFPALLVYVLSGPIQWVTLGFLGSRTSPESIYWAEEPDHRDAMPSDERIGGLPARGSRAALEDAPADAPRDAEAIRRRRRRRRPRGGPGSGPKPPHDHPRGGGPAE